jgi:hypothetical protein
VAESLRNRPPPASGTESTPRRTLIFTPEDPDCIYIVGESLSSISSRSASEDETFVKTVDDTSDLYPAVPTQVTRESVTDICDLFCRRRSPRYSGRGRGRDAERV